MSTPGDDFPPPPNTPPNQEPVPPAPPPNTPPTGGPGVARPRFGDGNSADFAPNYGEPHASPPTAATPPAPYPTAAPAPIIATEAIPPPNRTPASRRTMIAPIVAAIVLFGGIGFLVLRSGSPDAGDTDGPQVSGVEQPDGPTVDTTIPLQTSPPLIEPTTTLVNPDTTVSAPTTVATTVATTTTTTTTTTTIAPPSPGGPTIAEVEAALLTIGDLGPGPWTEESIDLVDVCGTNPEDGSIDIRRDRLFQEILTDPIAVRQVGSTLISYSDDPAAERALTAEVALLEGCNATTVDFEGVEYRVQVNSDSFTAEQAESFPCAQQSSFLILQLTNENAVVPYIGQTSVSFRCGRNVTVTALTTTIDLADLTDEDFFNAAGTANLRAGTLAGS
ncbi:MAG: hypothetical protein AB8G14_06170 [Ilumatobacter sp.]